MKKLTQNEIDKIAKQVLRTCFIAFLYMTLWIGLEYVIEGQITDSLVDNLVMLSFIPTIWIAVNKKTKNK